MKFAFVGNPNSGKTTLYNALTGKNEHAGNWSGVTVDQKEAHIKKKYSGENEIIAVDLPGAYSINSFTLEEDTTKVYIHMEKPDVIINIVDATNLSRSLYFTTQLLELGIPVIIALNKIDVNEKKKTEIDIENLSLLLNCEVVETSATSGVGLETLITKAISIVGKPKDAPYIGENINFDNEKSIAKGTKKRFGFVNKVVAQVETRAIKTSDRNSQDKFDSIVTSRWLGIPIFAVVMFLVFAISQTWVGPLVADFLVGALELFKEWVRELTVDVNPFLQSLLVDGIIGGFIAVVGFLPLVMVLYFLIAILEDCGYMSRVAVLMDGFFKKLGLSGKSIIPIIIGMGCAIPGVMASRTIKNERERRATAMLTPFMPCGAKLPVIALFSGAFFGNEWWVSPLMYFCGILFIVLGALLVKLITRVSAKKSYFIMELAEYKVPSIKNASLSMLERGKEFIIKAGTIILLCNALVQIMQSFNWQFELIEEGAEKSSILASIASPFAVILIPLGFGAWQLAAAAITGFIAKENVVGTLAVCFGITDFINGDLELVGGASTVAETMGLTSVAALAYLMFNLFTPPCFAAIGAMNAELGSKKWFWGAIGLQAGTGYTVAFLVYQFGTLFTTGSFGEGFIGGLIAVSAIILIIVFIAIRSGKKLDDNSVAKEKVTTKI